MAFISGPRSPGCIFCDLPRRDDARESLVLARTRASVVILNKYPYASAHLLIAPRRHAADLDRLPPAERSDLAETLRRSITILRRELAAEGINVGLNLGRAAGAGIDDHLHWHVVPRWVGDNNFMPALASVRVIPQHLLDTWDRLRPSFAPLERARRRG
jgi:ATP adenylyltransferase